MRALDQRQGLNFFGQVSQEWFDGVQHGLAAIGHIIHHHDHFIGKIHAFAEFDLAGCFFIEGNFYQVGFNGTDLLQQLLNIAGNGAAIVLYACQYDLLFVQVVFHDLVGYTLQFTGYRSFVQDIISGHEFFFQIYIKVLRWLCYLSSMSYIPQIIFILVVGFSTWFFTKKIRQIRRNILLGKDVELKDQPAERWKNMVLFALGQKKMFRNPLVAVMHFFIYAGFIIINIEVLEIVLDGVFGTHRMFAGIGSLYTGLINAFEFLALTVLVSCLIFLIRRNIVRVKRLASPDLNGWPRSDANYILLTEVILMSLFLTMNASDTLLQERANEHITGNFYFSSFIHPLLNGFSDGTLVSIERTCWWAHIVGIFAFLCYIPFSKHLHIFLAFPNAYYTRLQPMGKMNNMPAVQNEVLYAMQPETAPTDAQPPVKFGAKDVMDLSWRNLLDAYSCTECGRCSAACPATITGKKLSPRRIMMATRDRAEDVGKNIDANGEFKDDGKTLLHDYISVEELRACTSCNSCVQECPVNISPLEIILELRRSLIMEESNAPQEWNGMFSNIENNFAPWKFSPDDRDKWAVEMKD
jgi:heterodisulfide reductase subunit C